MLEKHTPLNLSIPLLLTTLLFSNTKLMSESIIEKSAEWDTIRDGEYLIENCTWNTSATEGAWSETIFCDPQTGLRGWRWDFSEEKSPSTRQTVKSFPEIIYGKKPFDVYPATTPKLPTPLSTLSQLTLEYDYTVQSIDAVYDTTTDITFTDSVTPGPANIRAKVMIWLDSKDTPFFPDQPHSQAIIDGLKHEVYIDPDYSEPGQHWVFIALRPEGHAKQGEFHLNEYFDYLISMGALDPAWFLSSVEIGTELCSGKGEIRFNKFIVR